MNLPWYCCYKHSNTHEVLLWTIPLNITLVHIESLYESYHDFTVLNTLMHMILPLNIPLVHMKLLYESYYDITVINTLMHRRFYYEPHHDITFKDHFSAHGVIIWIKPWYYF